MNKNIFSDIQAITGCRCVSDLPYLKRAVWFDAPQKLETFGVHIIFIIILNIIKNKIEIQNHIENPINIGITIINDLLMQHKSLSYMSNTN